MQTKHTPGPWHRNIKPATKYNTIFSGRNTHVTRLAVEGKTEEEVEANCALIVAAPELLACLLDVLDADGDLDAMDFNRYRAAIAKATG